jgi:ATP-dependent Lhr-like helicase
MLATTRSVIVDEIHAVAATKRGAHLALSLERLADLTGGRLQRVGLSATQKPIQEVARFLVGAAGGECTIVDSGHVRTRDIALVLPDSPLEAVMSTEVWNTLYDKHAPHGGTRDAASVRAHRRGEHRRAPRQPGEGTAA